MKYEVKQLFVLRHTLNKLSQIEVTSFSLIGVQNITRAHILHLTSASFKMRSTNYFLSAQAEVRFQIQQVCRTVMETFSTQQLNLFYVCLNAKRHEIGSKWYLFVLRQTLNKSSQIEVISFSFLGVQNKTRAHI